MKDKVVSARRQKSEPNWHYARDGAHCATQKSRPTRPPLPPNTSTERGGYSSNGTGMARDAHYPDPSAETADATAEHLDSESVGERADRGSYSSDSSLRAGAAEEVRSR